jgi:hypothetical protein
MLIRNCPGVSLFQKITRVASGVPSAIRAAREVSEPSGRNFVRYRVDTWESAHPRVQLTYDRYAEHLDYPVFLETSLSQFGGLRWWFQCPLCRRRVQKLFLPPRASRFACRHCHNLSYATRNQSPKDRCMEAARCIRLRLGGSASLLDAFPDKPKRMWWRTYQRLWERYERYDHASLLLLMEWVDRNRQKLRGRNGR